jgi:hypothetical protein
MVYMPQANGNPGQQIEVLMNYKGWPSYASLQNEGVMPQSKKLAQFDVITFFLNHESYTQLH